MSDQHTLTIKLTKEESHCLEVLAQHHGYQTAAEYVRTLITEAIDNEYWFETKEGMLEALRQSWHQAMTGQTYPISML